MEENEVLEQKTTTLKSLEKEVNLKLADLNQKMVELDRQIETIKKAIKSRGI